MIMSPRPTTLFISNVEWGFVWQRHQTLAAFFARDSEVIFCEVPAALGRYGARVAAVVDAGPPQPGGKTVVSRRRAHCAAVSATSDEQAVLRIKRASAWAFCTT
jgi:hypothetical protein